MKMTFITCRYVQAEPTRPSEFMAVFEGDGKYWVWNLSNSETGDNVASVFGTGGAAAAAGPRRQRRTPPMSDAMKSVFENPHMTHEIASHFRSRPTELQEIGTRRERVHCAAISPNGKYVAMCYVDAIAAIWDARSGQKLHVGTTSVDYPAKTHALAWSSDSAHLALGVANNMDVLPSQLQQGNIGKYGLLLWNNCTQASETTIRTIYNSPEGTKIMEFMPAFGMLIASSTNNKHIVCVFKKRLRQDTIIQYNIDTKTRTSSTLPHETIGAVGISSNAQYIAQVDPRFDWIKVYLVNNVINDTRKNIVNGYALPSACKWSEDNKRIAVAESRGWNERADIVTILNWPDTHTHVELPATPTVYLIAWSPDGAQIATLHELAIRVWDSTSGDLITTYYSMGTGAGQEFEDSIFRLRPQLTVPCS